MNTESNPHESMPLSAVKLMGDIMTKNQADSSFILNQLYRAERRRRMALEVLLTETLKAAKKAAGGTTREYESVLDWVRLAYYLSNTEEQTWARQHADYSPEDGE